MGFSIPFASLEAPRASVGPSTAVHGFTDRSIFSLSEWYNAEYLDLNRWPTLFPSIWTKHADAFGYVYNSRLSHRPYTSKPPDGRQFDPATPMIFDGQPTDQNAFAMDSAAFSPRHVGSSLGNVATIDGHVKALRHIDLSVRYSK